MGKKLPIKYKQKQINFIIMWFQMNSTTTLKDEEKGHAQIHVNTVL